MNRASKKIIIIGGIGNGSVIAAAIGDANLLGQKGWQVAGYINDRLQEGNEIEGYPVMGGLDDVQTFIDKGYYFINAIYRIDGQDKRIARFEGLNIPHEQLATFVHPKSYIASNVELSPGCVVMPNASISPGVHLGHGCLVMVNANIGHNNYVNDYCHFAAQSCIGSYTHIHKGVHIGLNASVRENLTLGVHSTLAMGGVLLSDMDEYEIWGGVPARLLRHARKEL
jgi:acetyltransferase EpsM